MEHESEFNPEILKPKFLYHASPNQNIELFEPRAESVRDADEGPVVFATPDLGYASMFLVPVDDTWVQISTISGAGDNKHYIVISDKNRFTALDKGGAIYCLPNTDFTTDQHKSKNAIEWTSRTKVAPTNKIDYTSGLNAMIENNVQVYFVDSDTFEKIQQSPKHGAKILQNLQSENQKLGKNIVDIM